MNNSLQIQLVTLANGQRLLRLADEATGLTLERRLNPEQPLVAQKTKLGQMFEAMLRSELERLPEFISGMPASPSRRGGP